MMVSSWMKVCGLFVVVLFVACNADAASTDNISKEPRKLRSVPRCGGTLKVRCPRSFVCRGGERNNCGVSGSDPCTGRCARKRPSPQTRACPEGANIRYISRDGQQCNVIDISCRPWESAFTSVGCGCGCRSRQCGGFVGAQCPSGSQCVDIPNDGCDPQNGGADCIGMCVSNQCPADVKYTSRDANVCNRSFITCPRGSIVYTNDVCGCGCRPSLKPTTTKSCPKGANVISTEYPSCKTFRFACPANTDRFNVEGCGCGCKPRDKCPKQKGVRIFSRNFPSCRTLKFGCGAGTKRFNIDGCGCGCRPTIASCPSETDRGVQYTSKSRRRCATIRISCRRGYKPFSNRCGCGCSRRSKPKPKPKPKPSNCPKGNGVRYLSRSFPSCTNLDFACSPGMERFNTRGCGCGCKCSNSFSVTHISKSTRDCDALVSSITCEPSSGTVSFSNQCGCGCATSTTPSQPVCPSGEGVRYFSRNFPSCRRLRFGCRSPSQRFEIEGCGCGCQGLPPPRPQPAPPAPTFEWSVLVGTPCEQARRRIQRSDSSLEVVCIADGSPVTLDFRPNRVRIFFDEDGDVVRTPRRG